MELGELKSSIIKITEEQRHFEYSNQKVLVYFTNSCDYTLAGINGTSTGGVRLLVNSSFIKSLGMHHYKRVLCYFKTSRAKFAKELCLYWDALHFNLPVIRGNNGKYVAVDNMSDDDLKESIEFIAEEAIKAIDLCFKTVADFQLDCMNKLNIQVTTPLEEEVLNYDVKNFSNTDDVRDALHQTNKLVNVLKSEVSAYSKLIPKIKEKIKEQEIKIKEQEIKIKEQDEKIETLMGQIKNIIKEKNEVSVCNDIPNKSFFSFSDDEKDEELYDDSPQVELTKVEEEEEEEKEEHKKVNPIKTNYKSMLAKMRLGIDDDDEEDEEEEDEE